MLYVRVALFVTLLAASGCATSAKHTKTAASDQKALGKRIEHICALPESQRAAEIEKLKKESGMVLYCGK